MEFQIKTLQLRNAEEYLQLQQVREEAFTPWVKRLPPRCLVNLVSSYHSHFFLEAREIHSQTLAGCLFAAPAYWSGDISSLQTYDYYEKALSSFPWFGVTPNAYVLLAILVMPSFRSQKVPAALLAGVKEKCKRLGFSHILSPFRPSHYGEHKRQSRKVHSEELFRGYCERKNEEGFPQDPWLRVLVKNQMQPLKIELRSVQIEKSLPQFLSMKQNYKPEAWYEISPNTWECGETATWYVDPFRRVVLSVEPNLWGRIDPEISD